MTDTSQTEHTESDAALASTIPTTMRAATARRYGDADQIAIEEIPTPEVPDDQMLLRVEASSLNALDWRFLTGTPYFLHLIGGLRRPKRIIHGADVAGTVVAVGSAVSEFAVGDEVFGETNGGGLGPFMVVKETWMVAKPKSVSFDDAAAIPCAGLTALQGLRTHADVQPGERVLINGGAGGVGTFAVQIAAALGAEVTAVCSTRNVDMVRRLGATRVVDYTREDVVALGEQFDVMIDNVGNRSAAECIALMAPGGRYVMVSAPISNPWLDPLPKMLRTRLAFRRADATFHQFTAAANQADLTHLGEMVESGDIVPEIDRVVGLDGVADALAEIGTGHTRSKIVVHPAM